MGYPILEWDDKWIEENHLKYKAVSEMHRAYIAETKHFCKQQSFRTHIRRKYALTSKLTWTKEESDWVAKNFSRMGSEKAAVEFAKVFGKDRGRRSLEAEARRQHIKIDEDVVIANRRYPRRVPIGTVVDDGEGYLKIKVGVEYSSSGWVRYHRYLYEQRHGKLKKGYKIMFLDGDKRNYADDNMIAVPASYFALMNKLDLRSEFPEVNLASVKWCDLYMALRKKGYILKRGDFIKEFDV